MVYRMNDNLKCPVCGSELELEVPFDGCDWNSREGEGSRFDYQIALCCPKMGCGRVFPIGRIKKESDFSIVLDKYRRFK
jgi:hypothetical protein